MSELQNLPSVDNLLKTKTAAELVADYGRSLTLEAIRSELEDIRNAFAAGQTVPVRAALLEAVQQRLESWTTPSLVPVINATGVVLHTNLGRAPLSRAALEAMTNVAAGYSTLEYDLAKGQRGSRTLHAEELLMRITGAEAALVVNNNAAAVMLALSALARRRRVIISRSQLVEIGGGFRVPDVMRQSGAKLVEVGTTNRVHLQDYEAALNESAALVMQAHHSNFRIVGFTSEPELQDLADLTHRYGIWLLDDLGSGALLDTARFGLAHEPTVQESLAAGADVVCFSGDKLLGGPQAGIVVGKADLLQKMKKHPFARAVRADKLCLSALSATLLHYLKDEAEREIPIWQMISATPAQVEKRARHWVSVLKQGEVIKGKSTVGGGSLPEEELDTFLVALEVLHPDRFLRQLRGMNPPVIGRVQADMVVLDPRTVLGEQEDALLVGVQNALTEKDLAQPKRKKG
jgi:L-seryl-tRNA(Ser) seleniumtransferase